MLSYDDDDEDDRRNDEEWNPPPPPEDGEYEDPNPRAVVDDTPRQLPPRQVSAKQANEEAAAANIAEAIKRIGLKGTLSELLEVVAREQKPDEQKTCPVCGEETPMLHSAMIAGSLRPRAECGKCQGKRNRNRVEHTAKLVRDLKQIAENGGDGEREREIVKQLREYDHPDIDGLERHCRDLKDRASKSQGSSKKKGYGFGF